MPPKSSAVSAVCASIEFYCTVLYIFQSKEQQMDKPQRRSDKAPLQNLLVIVRVGIMDRGYLGGKVFFPSAKLAIGLLSQPRVVSVGEKTTAFTTSVALERDKFTVSSVLLLNSIVLGKQDCDGQKRV